MKQRSAAWQHWILCEQKGRGNAQIRHVHSAEISRGMIPPLSLGTYVFSSAQSQQCFEKSTLLFSPFPTHYDLCWASLHYISTFFFITGSTKGKKCSPSDPISTAMDRTCFFADWFNLQTNNCINSLSGLCLDHCSLTISSNRMVLVIGKHQEAKLIIFKEEL